MPLFTMILSLIILVLCRAVPQASEFLDAQPLAKGKTEKTKKKKEGKNAQRSAEASFMTVPAPQLHLMSNGDSTPGPSASASPAPKPGFSRISSMVDNPSQEGTPVPGERPKVAFGLSMKRKAEEDATATPPSKRR